VCSSDLVNVTAVPSGQWANPPASAEPAGLAAPNLMAFVHALRRHWVMATGLGLLCAAIAGPAVWFAIGDRFTASSRLHVKMQVSGILSVNDTKDDRDRFEIYKNTQMQYLLDRYVLTAAIRKPEVARLPSVRAQEGADPVAWLGRQLSVGFPGKAEMMEVCATRADPREATAFVNAVVEAYLAVVVNAERDLKQQSLNELDRAFATKQIDYRDKLAELRKLAQEVDTDVRETLTLKQKLALEELNIYRQELARIQFDLRRALADLAAQQAGLKAVDSLDVSDADVDLMAQNDPVARQLFIELGWRTIDQAYNTGRVLTGKEGRLTPFVQRYEKDRQMLQEQFDTRRAALMELVRQRKRSQFNMEIIKVETLREALKEQEKELKGQVDVKQKDAEKFGRSSIDVEVLRAEKTTLEAHLADISSKRDKLNVEVRNASRVSLFAPAELPEVTSNWLPRIALTLLVMLTGLCCPAAVIALWDTRAGRINDLIDVSKGLHLPVIGSMPLIPAKVIHHLESPSKRYQRWHVRLTESVDGITARMLRKADIEQSRVIMVSSASSGEGKTTLSTQLALSLARAGRRTVLVDFDLRRPSFDGIFGLPLEPGVCEMLRQQNVVSDLVHPSATENLSVVTAGRWDRQALAALSNGSAAAMFRQIREEYDFVVVDTSPILPVADARFVSQHVDSVVLSVFRDVSQAPKIQAACEILAAFGVQTVEAVVTSPYEHGYYGYKGYEGYGTYGAYGTPPSA
jgi:capsular exopolysaccharide synthesis family protein